MGIWKLNNEGDLNHIGNLTYHKSFSIIYYHQLAILAIFYCLQAFSFDFRIYNIII